MVAEEQMTLSEIQTLEASGLDIKAASLDYKRLEEKIKEVTTCVESHNKMIKSLRKDKLSLKKVSKKFTEQNQEIMAELGETSSYMSNLKEENIKLRAELTQHIAKMECVSEKADRKEMVFVDDQQHVAELKEQIKKLTEESAQYQSSLEVQCTVNKNLTSKLGFFPKGFLKRAKRCLREARKSPINIFVFGLSGCGKSALGRSILQSKGFKGISSLQQGFKQVQCETGEYNGRRIRVFEWPDFCYNNDKRQSESFVKLQMPKVLEKCPNDFPVTLVVLKFGDCITDEVMNLVEVLKATFGQNTLKESGVIVLTRGDIFKKTVIESFSDWLKVQDGHLKELMAACNGRALLFDNILKDNDVQAKQLQNLMNMVDEIILDHTFVLYS